MTAAFRSVRGFVRSCERSVRDYTAGLRAQDVKRLFDRDATEAFDVLAREQGEPQGGTLWRRLRIVFLGLSYRLTPARRMLFAAGFLAFLLGLFGASVSIGGPFRLMSRAWFVLAFGTVVFLLALELVDRIRVRDELEVARQLQREMLPDELPSAAGWATAHADRTANEVGGDFYDMRQLDDGRLVLVIGDASGHGMAAGLLMAIANATLRMAIDVDPAPAEVLRLLNRTLCGTGDRRAFMTLFYALLDPLSGCLEFASAGHPFPFHRRVGGEVEELGSGGLPLGIRDDLDFEQQEARIEPGETLVLFTDGIPEGANPSGDSFGYERLRGLLRAPASPQGLLDRVLVDFDRHLGGEPLRDDVSIVVVGREHVVPPPPPVN